MRARHPTCKCGHSFGSHAAGGFGKCMTGWPFGRWRTDPCPCEKFRPRSKRKAAR